LRLAGHTITVVCLIDGKFVGTAGLTVDYKLDGTIIGFFEDFNVAKEYRGRGFGALITNYIQYTAWDLGCNQILGFADRDSVASRIHPKLGGKEMDGIWWYKDHPYDGITRDDVMKAELAKHQKFM